MIGRRGCLAGTLVLAGVSCLGAMLLTEFGKPEVGKWLGWFQKPSVDFRFDQ